MGKNRPSDATFGVKLLWFILFFGTILGLYELPRSLEYLKTNGVGITFYVVTLILSLFFNIFLFHKVSRGRNWARITLLVLFIIGLPGALYSSFSVYGWKISVFQILLLIIQGYAYYLLFTKESSKWFKSNKN